MVVSSKRLLYFFFLMIRRPPRSTLDRSSAASDVYKRQQQEDWKTAALRELEEETGWTAERMEKLTEGPSSAGLTNECIIFALAHGVHRGKGQQPDGDEQITVHEIPLDQADAWLREQE